MTTANTADACRQDAHYLDRPYAAPRAQWPDRGAGAERSSRPLRTGPARPARPADRLRAADGRGRDIADFPRTPAPRRAPEPDRAVGRMERGRPEGRRPSERRPVERRPDEWRPEDRRPVERRPAARDRYDEFGATARFARRGGASSARPRPAGRAAEEKGILGALAVAGTCLVTLAGAGVDSFVGIGLGLVTLVTLVAVTGIATLAVRRRDLASVVVAPPLVFVAVAAANIALAPSASFNLATIATLLVRGFPTMALATGVALVLALVRLAARR